MLYIKNSHERDGRIRLDTNNHVYRIDNKETYKSVTTVVHEHFEHFDCDKIIKKMKSGKYWGNSKYYGMSDQEIKSKWNNEKLNASSKGTLLHENIESFFNSIDINDNSIEFQYFLNFMKNHPNLKPYRTEMRIFDEKTKVAGTIDMLFINEYNQICIFDWKRCKQIRKHNTFKKFANSTIIKHIPDTNYWHYCLQLHIYRNILCKNYFKEINISKDMFLVVLHPNNKNYFKIKIEDVSKEANDILENNLSV